MADDSGKSKVKSATYAYILLVIFIILTIIAVILSIVQLQQIQKNSNYSNSKSLQNAYGFSITVLVFNLYVAIFLIIGIIILARNKGFKSGSVLIILVISVLSLFGAILLCGFAAAASKNSAAIGNLAVMIIGFIIGIALIFFVSRLPSEVKTPCSLTDLKNYGEQLNKELNTGATG